MVRPLALPFLLALAALSGCRTAPMKATAACTFTAERHEGYFHTRYTVPPDAKCSFGLEAPVRKAAHVKEFAEGFATMLNRTPDAGPKAELKLAPKEPAR